jgi:hypothetical protein
MEDDQMILLKTSLWDELSHKLVDALWRPVANVVGRKSVVLFAALMCHLSHQNVVVTVIAIVGLTRSSTLFGNPGQPN